MSCHVFLSCMHVNLLLGNPVTKIWTRAHPGSRAVWGNICVSKDYFFVYYFSPPAQISQLSRTKPQTHADQQCHLTSVERRRRLTRGLCLDCCQVIRTCNKDMSNSSSTTCGECGFYLFSQYKASNHYCADYYSSSLCFSLCPPLLWVSRQLNLRRFM